MNICMSGVLGYKCMRSSWIYACQGFLDTSVRGVREYMYVRGSWIQVYEEFVDICMSGVLGYKCMRSS